jgi:putative inorganic carbon (HCO3(-)) transporter
MQAHLRVTGRSSGFGRRLRSRMQRLVIPLLIIALGLIIARGPLAMSAAMVVGAIGSTLLLLHPTLGIYALAFAIPFGSIRQVSIAGISLDATDLLVAGVATAWMMRMLAGGRLRAARAPLTGPLLLYIATLSISLLQAEQWVPAVKELVKWIQALLVYLFIAGELGANQRRMLVLVLLIAGSAQGLLGIYQFVRQVGPPGFILMGRYMRAHGTFSQPNPYGGYMGLLLPLAYSLMFVLWPRRGSRNNAASAQHPLLWVLAVASSAIMGAALLMSWSRGALLGLVVGMGWVATAGAKRAWPLLASLILVAALVAPLMSALLPEGLASRLVDSVAYIGVDIETVEVTDENFAVIERMAHWIAAWRMFSQSPWLGVGTGQYAVVYASVAPSMWEDPLGHAHNYYLNVLGESGLLSLGTYLLFMLTALIATWRVAARSHGLDLALALGSLGMLGHLTAHNAFDNLYVHGMYLLVAMLLSIATWPIDPEFRKKGASASLSAVDGSSA